MSDKPLAERLLLKSGRSFRVIDPPLSYAALLGPLPVGVPESSDKADIIQLFVRDRRALATQLPQMKTCLNPKGILWVTYHKGTSKDNTDINRDSINEFAKGIGWQGVAIISIDEDWSALRLKPL